MLLAGCQSPQVAPAPTAVPLAVEVTPALSWMRETMAECAVEIPQLSLTVQSTGRFEQSLQDADILFQWTETPAASGTPFVIGADRMIFIVHPENPLQEIDAEQLAAVYSGTVSAWDELTASPSGAIQIWVYPSDDDTQTLFAENVLAYAQITGSALIAPDPAAMLAAVAADPQAIGFIPARWLNQTVKAISVIGYANDDLEQPVLAILEAEPSGLPREWLLCVQANLQP